MLVTGGGGGGGATAAAAAAARQATFNEIPKQWASNLRPELQASGF